MSVDTTLWPATFWEGCHTLVQECKIKCLVKNNSKTMGVYRSSQDEQKDGGSLGKPHCQTKKRMQKSAMWNTQNCFSNIILLHLKVQYVVLREKFKIFFMLWFFHDRINKLTLKDNAVSYCFTLCECGGPCHLLGFNQFVHIWKKYIYFWVCISFAKQHSATLSISGNVSSNMAKNHSSVFHFFLHSACCWLKALMHGQQLQAVLMGYV